MSDSQSKTPTKPPVPNSTIALLCLNGAVVAIVLALSIPLIQLALFSVVIDGNGLNLADPRTIWAASLLFLSLLALFSLWRCRRPTPAWSFITIISLTGLIIHGFTFTHVTTGWLTDWLSNPDNRVVIDLATIRILLAILLILDLLKFEQPNSIHQ